jgi:Family of unknown function (DUF6157)
MENVDYRDTFITVAPDSTAVAGVVPEPRGGRPTVASATFEMVADRPYAFRSSDVIFTVWADRRDVPTAERATAWAEFYSKGQACLRGSDLGKRYGWGIHSDTDGRIALYAVGSAEYDAFAAGTSPLDGAEVTVRPAMRSSRG